jgi:hypothetical protein
LSDRPADFGNSDDINRPAKRFDELSQEERVRYFDAIQRAELVNEPIQPVRNDPPPSFITPQQDYFVPPKPKPVPMIHDTEARHDFGVPIKEQPVGYSPQIRRVQEPLAEDSPIFRPIRQNPATPSVLRDNPPETSGLATPSTIAYSAIKRKNPIITLTVILALIAGVFAGIPVYAQVNNTIAESTGGFVPKVSTGDSKSGSTPEELSTAVWTAQQISASAEGKADATDLQQKITDAQTLVADTAATPELLGESEKALVVAAETLRISVNAADVNAASVEIKRKLGAGEFHSGATREDDVRNMLDTLGGQDIGIIYQENPCDRSNAAGCVSSDDPTVMYISPTILDRSYYEDYMLLQTIAHEYGHTVHFREGYYRVLADPVVKAAFGDDAEYVADCMAQDISGVTFTTYGYTCNASQLTAARKIWNDDLSS